MHFLDECELTVRAGDGGNGAIAFRREKFVPFGGPAGGDGGKGGDVVLEASEGLGTLYDLNHLRTVRAERGADGQGKDKYGRKGRDEVVRVPVGTVVWDRETGERITELTEHQQRVVIARGGDGGRGNKHFTTPVDRAPRRAEPGHTGEHREIRLELKVMADVGLLGFPNAGKSTFIRAVSRAKPKVADYPFTTLVPHLGVATVGEPGFGGRSFVIADIPGLIPGASEGAGLGIRFLKHVERTRVLLHLVTLDDDPERDPLSDYRALRDELGRFDAALAERPEVVALTKADLPDTSEAYPALAARFAEVGVELHLISSASQRGVGDLLRLLARYVSEADAAGDEPSGDREPTLDD